MIKKKLISIIFLSLILINTTTIHAADFTNPAMNDTESLNDFSMDMMMDQSHMAIDAGNEGINNAEETNIMNHQLDDSMNVLLNDSPLDLDNKLNTNPSETADALVNGNWSDSFNDYFDSNNGETNSDINFYNNENQEPGNSNSNGSDSSSNDMPQLEFANDESISSIDNLPDNQTDDNTTGLIDNTTVILNNDSHDDALGNNAMPSDDVIDNDSLSSFDVSAELPEVPEIKIVDAPKIDVFDYKDDDNTSSSDNNAPSDDSSKTNTPESNDDDDD